MTAETVRAQGPVSGDPVANRAPGRPQDGNRSCVCETARPAEQQVLLHAGLERNEGTNGGGKKAHKWWQLLFVSKLCSQ